MEISQVLQKAVETPEPFNYSTKLSKVLNHEERGILNVKYLSKRFRNMTSIELFDSCRVVLLKISVITGFNLPEDEFNNILVEQMCKKMIESYPDVNINEVEYAFRNKDLSIKDWGKYFNIGILDQVMIPYLEKRYEVSKIEESIKSKPLLIESKKELTDNDMEDWVNETRRCVTDISKVFIIPTEIYDWLYKNKKIELTKKEKFENIGHSIKLRYSQLSEAALNGRENESKELAAFVSMKEKGIFVGYESDNLKRLAKKISVFNYFKNINNEYAD